jgi:hypothetical protein
MRLSSNIFTPLCPRRKKSRLSSGPVVSPKPKHKGVSDLFKYIPNSSRKKALANNNVLLVL